MINWVLGILILGGAAWIAYRYIMSLKKGEGCCGCSGCGSNSKCSNKK